MKTSGKSLVTILILKSGIPFGNLNICKCLALGSAQSKKFYIKAQKGYLNLAKKNKRRYIILDTSKSIQANEKQIYDNFLERVPK